MKSASSSEENAKQHGVKLRAYFASLRPEARRRVKQLREAIRREAPGATEVISYGIPAFRLNGRILVWYAAWKNHSSLYPIIGSVKRAHATELKGYETSKGTVRFPNAKPLPAGLVKQLVKGRVAELSQKKGKSK